MNVKFVAPTQQNGVQPQQAQPAYRGPASVDPRALAHLQQEVARFHASVVGALTKIGADMATMANAIAELDRRTRGVAQAQPATVEGQVVEAGPPQPARQIANAKPGDGARLPDVMFEGGEEDD